jgi:hypothetical protein
MGMEGWSWQRGEREVQGSLYWEEFRARAAICITTSIIAINSLAYLCKLN